MAGETIREKGVCLRIVPWSQTSHVVAWQTPNGRVMTIVKGAERSKSFFLGQYDLNYTCEILYYARAKGELHALRECSPMNGREALRGDYRALALADYVRDLTGRFSPIGSEAMAWYGLLTETLDRLNTLASETHLTFDERCVRLLQTMIFTEIEILHLSGLAPEIEAENGVFRLRGERKLIVSEDVVQCLKAPFCENDLNHLLDTLRVIGVFYAFHLDCAPDVRRTVLRMIS